MNEVHLFIIWSNAECMREKIIENLGTRFTILGLHRVSWNKENFPGNLTRFYGENLPKNSNKERTCGNGPFTLVVVLDKSPLYRVRMTSKGIRKVNVNIFDSKEMYRSWTGGGHMIHGTNDFKEVKHDLVLLTGLSVEDYIKKWKNANRVLDDEFTAMPGEVSWESPEQLLYVLNETVEYVILRNFDGIFSEVGRSIHGDVDILTNNFEMTLHVLNAQRRHRSKYRVKSIVRIGDGGVYFDIRYVGDNYYCKKWEEEILKKRYITEKGYYRTDEENFKFSLLYHALVHKKTISSDYAEILHGYFMRDVKEESPNNFANNLCEFLNKKEYLFCEPNDYSVYYNKLITGEGMSMKKVVLKIVHKFFRD